jgi:hypothetical protein
LPELAELASVQVDVAGEIANPAGPVSVMVVAVDAALRRMAVPVTAAPVVVTDVDVVPVPEFETSKLNVVEPVPPVYDFCTARRGARWKVRSSMRTTWNAGLFELLIAAAMWVTVADVTGPANVTVILPVASLNPALVLADARPVPEL